MELKINENKSLIIGIIYRPNTAPKADIDIFTKSVFDINNIICKENKEAILLGDFNMDLLKFESHHKINLLLENMLSQGYLPVITKPTRVTPTTATLIDHIYTNISSPSYTSGILINDVADHFGTFISVSKKVPAPITKYIKFRSYKSENILAFKQLLASCDFTTLINHQCANDAYNTFLQAAFDISFPEKIVKTKRKYLKREPWITNGILNSSNQKAKLYTKKLKTPNATNIQKYKLYCKIYNRVKRAAKLSHFKHMLDSNKNNIKQTWKILNQAINKQNAKPCIPDTFVIDDNLVSDKQQISDKFNSFFANIGNKTQNSVPKSKYPPTEYLKKHYPNNHFLRPTDPYEISRITAKLNNTTSTGFDNISTNLLKCTANEIAIPLSHIINLSFSTGIVPDKMKIAKVIPIHKSGNKTDFNNYRPISILPACSKILERMVHIRLMTFLNKYDILYNHQYGF